MSKNEKELPVPQHEIDAIARCLLPDILKYYESKEGRRNLRNGKSKAVIVLQVTDI